MKHLLRSAVCLSLLSFGAASAAHAQAAFNQMMSTNAILAIRSANSRPQNQQKETLFVMPASYQAHAFPQKRTPANKLPKAGKGGTEIAAIEQLLASRSAALQADSTALLISQEQEQEFSRLRTNLEVFNSFWNTDPYSDEMRFYRQHDDVRRRLAKAAESR